MTSAKSKPLGIEISELCDILKACGEAKVHKIRLGSLYLEFGPDSSQVKPPPATEIVAQEKRSLLQDEQKVKQDQLENMLLEDPEGYEELLLGGDLVDGQDRQSL